MNELKGFENKEFDIFSNITPKNKNGAASNPEPKNPFGAIFPFKLNLLFSFPKN